MPHIDLEEMFERDGWGDMPEAIADLFRTIPLWVPESEEDEERVVYQRAKRGHCMTCDAHLGPTTMLTLTAGGIAMMFCGGACYTDMQVMGWLEEQYSDMVDAVKFRGGAGDGSV